jgi:hypothetical protein
MMVTVFYGLITLMFRVNPPPMFLRLKFGKKKWGQYTSKYGNRLTTTNEVSVIYIHTINTKTYTT